MILTSLRLASLALLLPLTAALAHDGDDARLAELNASLERGGSVALLLERAELHRRADRWAQATRDLDHARRLAPAHPDLALARARLLVDARLFRDALPILDAELTATPDAVEARELRAHTLAQLGALDAAVADLDRVLASAIRARPDLLLHRARLLGWAAEVADSAEARREKLERALAGLEQSLADHGSLPALELEALAVERRLGRIGPALARIERLAAVTPRPEAWHARRGDVLREARRHAEARAAYAACLAAIDALPSRHRRTRAMASLASAARRHLTDLPR